MYRAILALIVLTLSPVSSAMAARLDDAVAAAYKGEYAVAYRLLRPLAGNGDARAQFNVGYMYANGWGVQRDYDQAIGWYRKAADQGLPIAQHYLGMAYAEGDGVSQDDTEAVRWFRRAANQGYPIAQFSLGLAYANGWGVPQDLVDAYTWLVMSGQQGISSARQVRKELSGKMTSAQIAQAQKIIQRWQPKPEQNQAGISESPPRGLLGVDAHVGELADPSVWPVSAVGVVTIALFERRRYCTGTVVGPKLVVTAAHCVFHGKQLVDPGNVHFLAGMNRGVPAASSVAEHLIVSKDFTMGDQTEEGTASDWALVVLKDPLPTKPVPVRAVAHEQLDAISRSGTVGQIGYGQERPYSPSIARNCRLRESPDDRVFSFRCLSNFGYSGSPIIADIEGNPKLIGIDSRGYPEVLLGMACSANQFEERVLELIAANREPHR